MDLARYVLVSGHSRWCPSMKCLTFWKLSKIWSKLNQRVGLGSNVDYTKTILLRFVFNNSKIITCPFLGLGLEFLLHKYWIDFTLLLLLFHCNIVPFINLIPQVFWHVYRNLHSNHKETWILIKRNTKNIFGHSLCANKSCLNSSCDKNLLLSFITLMCLNFFSGWLCEHSHKSSKPISQCLSIYCLEWPFLNGPVLPLSLLSHKNDANYNSSYLWLHNNQSVIEIRFD